jgi:hypothetical protein
MLGQPYQRDREPVCGGTHLQLSLRRSWDQIVSFISLERGNKTYSTLESSGIHDSGSSTRSWIGILEEELAVY